VIYPDQLSRNRLRNTSYGKKKSGNGQSETEAKSAYFTLSIAELIGKHFLS
jgi:hypothetical protein